MNNKSANILTMTLSGWPTLGVFLIQCQALSLQEGILRKILDPKKLGSFSGIYVFFWLFPDLSSVVSTRSCPVMGTLERDLVKMLDSTRHHLPILGKSLQMYGEFEGFP